MFAIRCGIRVCRVCVSLGLRCAFICNFRMHFIGRCDALCHGWWLPCRFSMWEKTSCKFIHQPNSIFLTEIINYIKDEKGDDDEATGNSENRIGNIISRCFKYWLLYRFAPSSTNSATPLSRSWPFVFYQLLKCSCLASTLLRCVIVFCYVLCCVLYSTLNGA